MLQKISFSGNQLKANPDKCHFLCSLNSGVSLTIENLKKKIVNW